MKTSAPLRTWAILAYLCLLLVMCGEAMGRGGFLQGIARPHRQVPGGVADSQGVRAVAATAAEEAAAKQEAEAFQKRLAARDVCISVLEKQNAFLQKRAAEIQKRIAALTPPSATPVSETHTNTPQKANLSATAPVAKPKPHAAPHLGPLEARDAAIALLERSNAALEAEYLESEKRLAALSDPKDTKK
jgi:hypothetical protein